MRRLVLALLFLMFNFNLSPAIAAEDSFSLDLNPETKVADFEARVEYNENDSLDLNVDNKTKNFFDMLKNDLDVASFSVKNVKGVDFEDIRNRTVAKRHTIDEYTIDEFFADFSQKVGNFTYGTSYSADIDTGEFEYNSKIYARYDNKYVGFQAAYGKDRYTTSGIQRDFVYLAPELKLGKGFVLKDDVRISVSGVNKKNEVVLKYTPPKCDRFDVEVGVGQVLYRDGYKKNVLRFGTTLRL